MVEVTALYFIGTDYLGFERLLPIHASDSSKVYLCTDCGNLYGRRIVTRDYKRNRYTTWAGLCSNCSPEPFCPKDEIPGGQPFFHQYRDPPSDVVLHQFLMELDYYDKQLSAALLPAGSQRPLDGSSGDGQDPLHRNPCGLRSGDLLPSP